MAVAGVGETAVAGGELLQALRRDVPEVARVRRVLRHHQRPPRHHRVDHRRRPRIRTTLPLPRHPSINRRRPPPTQQEEGDEEEKKEEE